jgi:hypothetical protein
VRYGSILRLATQSSAHFEFGRWSGGCIGAAPACIVAVDGDLAIGAHLSRKTDQVAVTVGGPGVVTSDPPGIHCGTRFSSCTAVFPEGLPLRLVGSPTASTDEVVWDDGCAIAPTCTLDVEPGLTSVVAIHRPCPSVCPGADRDLRVVVHGFDRVLTQPPGIDCSFAHSPCSHPFPWLSLVTLSGGFRWDGDCVGDAPRCRLFLDWDAGATVNEYSPLPRESLGTFALKLSVSPHSHGVVLVHDERSDKRFRCGFRARAGCNVEFRTGTRLLLKASGRAKFGGWAGFCSGRKACKLTMNQSKIVLAYFHGR